MSTALTQFSQDARLLPRVLCSVLVGLMVSACAAPVNQLGSPSTAISPTLSASPTLTTYVDAATGIAFQAPVGLYVTPAAAGAAGTTTQAIFSTYDRAKTAQQIDLTRELVVTASVVGRAPNEDLRAFAARNAQGVTYSVSDMPRLRGIVIEGTFQTGPRKYLLVSKSSETVLIVDAFPTYSSLVTIFDTVLATLQLK